MTDVKFDEKMPLGYVEGDVVAAQISAWALNLAAEAARIDNVSHYDMIMAMRELVNRIPNDTMEMLKRGECELEFGAMPFDEDAETVGGAQ